MKRYGIGIEYPNGHKDWSEYRSEKENRDHFNKCKEFYKARGCKVFLMSYDRANGSSFNFKVIEEA